MKTDRQSIVSVTKDDVQFETFRAGGNGGQNQNKRDTGVRVTHAPSGAVGVSREHRTQLENKRAAFRRMGESKKFQQWIRRETARRLGIDSAIRAEVERMMEPYNLRIETRNEKGRWVESAGPLQD